MKHWRLIVNVASMVLVFNSLALSQGVDSVAVEALLRDVPVKRIQWNANNFKDLVTGEEVTNSCYFVSTGLGKIEWVQSNGQVVYMFLVKSSTQAADGLGPVRLVRYSVGLDKLVGRIDIFVDRQRIKVRVDLESDTGDVIRNEYSISGYEIFPL